MSLWNQFAPLALEKILVPGGAFRMEHAFTGEGVKRRFFFVLNCNPKDDHVLLLTTASTQLEKRERARADNPEVLIHIAPSEYAPLTDYSVVDCGSALKMKKDQFELSVSTGNIEPLDPLPTDILQRLKQGVASAKTLDSQTKRIALGI